MVRLSSTVAAALLAASVTAQSGDDNVKIWAAAAYINHGEKTPSLGTLQEVLTPEGAQQMWRQGRAFRARYLNATEDLSDAEIEVAGSSPIQGIEGKAINNEQVDITAGEDEWVVGGALAFFQGLYPPVTNSYNSLAGGEDLARNLSANGSDTIEFPLNGYQYPLLQTLSSLDSESPGIQGTVGCTAWTSETNRPLKEKSDMKELEKDTQKFYHDLFSSPPLNGTIHPGAADIWNSYELYEYVSYVYTHNQTVHNGLDNANDTLYKLGKYALALQRAQNTKPDGETNETVKELYTIAGRTLAMRIADQLERNIDWDGDRDKLSIMFGSFEPILAFLSVGGLLTRENLLSGPFTRFPEPGAAMIFELISNITEDSDSIPKPEDLRIRFYYRASADENASFEGFSLFGFGNGGKSIPYTAFYREMMEMGVSSEEWCDVCNPATATWCSTGSDSSGEGTGDGSGNGNLTSTSQLHPALAGLIGALIMGAVVSLVAILLFALGGYRIRRVSPEERSRSTHGGGGGGGGSQGFKGPEKKASDADVTVSSVGAQQERVGSWEMKNGGYTVKGLGLRNETRDGYDTDGGVSVMGSAPVRPRESV